MTAEDVIQAIHAAIHSYSGACRKLPMDICISAEQFDLILNRRFTDNLIQMLPGQTDKFLYLYGFGVFVTKGPTEEEYRESVRRAIHGK